MNRLPKNKIFRWKNKNVSEAVYLKRKSASDRMKRKIESVRESTEFSPVKKPRLGTRLVNLDILRAGLKCKTCESVLSLNDILETRMIGEAEQYKIKCHNCLDLNDVYTSDYSNDKNGRKIFNINSRIALGAIDAGIGCNQINKFFADLNVPILNDHTYKRHERIVGLAVENVAKKSCHDAAQAERHQTIERIETLVQMV
ncbi:hypothetical protein ABEB36_000152 [Hypothenemus hampei]|uniref:Mutator-like transposase domain-containing protein n=1 Tax=Hypothenemus hampei TaxID=57062 RepID=A0ABD1FC84_HYPHA